MQKFTKEITVGNEPRSFEFTMMRNVNGEKCFITSIDEKKKPISFSLWQKEERNWKLAPGSLRWLYAIEGELSEAIEETRLS